MKPQDKPVRLCKLCKRRIPLIKGDYCDACSMTIANGGKPPLYICRECGETYGEEKVQKALKEGEKTQWKKSKCHICGKERQVTHYRHYGYLMKGHLAKKINREKVWKKLMPKKS